MKGRKDLAKARRGSRDEAEERQPPKYEQVQFLYCLVSYLRTTVACKDNFTRQQRKLVFRRRCVLPNVDNWAFEVAAKAMGLVKNMIYPGLYCFDRAKKAADVVQKVQLDYSEFFDENAGQTEGTFAVLFLAA